LYLTDCLSNVV